MQDICSCRVSTFSSILFAGGHINPAVTFAFFLSQKISLIRGILYIIFQVRFCVVRDRCSSILCSNAGNICFISL